MSQLEILVPFGLPPEKMAPALPDVRHLPALAMLVSRAASASRLPDFDPPSRAMPHEAWLAREAGLAADIDATCSPPLAAAAMRRYGLPPEEGYWFIVNPAHILVGQDNMILADRRTLELNEAESAALFEAAAPCFADAGLTVRYGDAGTWFLRADDWHTLRTATPDRACGRHLMHWMPTGEGELAWRNLLNNVQMAWHTDPVNIERKNTGKPAINALWLWGGGNGPAVNCPTAARPLTACRFAETMEAYGQCFPRQEDASDAASLLRRPPAERLLLLDELATPALRDDWSGWQAAYQRLENDWFVPLLDALRRGRLTTLTLHLSNDQTQKTFAVTPRSLRRFWHRPSLKGLLP